MAFLFFPLFQKLSRRRCTLQGGHFSESRVAKWLPAMTLAHMSSEDTDEDAPAGPRGVRQRRRRRLRHESPAFTRMKERLDRQYATALTPSQVRVMGTVIRPANLWSARQIPSSVSRAYDADIDES